MKTNRQFCKLQKFNNAKKINLLFTFLIAFFMTFSTVAQTDGIEFQCGQFTITFGPPDGEDVNGFPTWSNGELVSPNETGYTLFVEDVSGTPTWAVYDPESNGAERYYFTTVFNGTFPSCSVNDWSSETYLPCILSEVTCTGVSPEICDGIDNDGDGLIDEGFTVITYYADVDQDGFGDPDNTVETCDGPIMGYVDNNMDCNDNNININPEATELCDGIDNNCNGIIDEGLILNTFYADIDGDGFGDPNNSISTCEVQPEGYVTDNTDCLDNGIGAETAYPGASEIPADLIDNDCDGVIDEDDDNVNIPVYCNEAKTKVLICHNGKDKCVSINAIDAHLAHGDSLGSCDIEKPSNQDDAEALDALETNLTTFNVISWPNPTTNLFNVRIQTPNLNDKVYFQAFDVNGRLIHTNVINGNEDYKFGELLSSGMYFIKLSQGDITQIIKVIKK